VLVGAGTGDPPPRAAGVFVGGGVEVGEGVGVGVGSTPVQLAPPWTVEPSSNVASTVSVARGTVASKGPKLVV
jgi:hypothetical protein